MVPLPGRVVLCGAILLAAGTAPAPAQMINEPTCADLLQKQDAGAVPVCKAQVDDAEKAPPNEHMARIVADDNYGVALLAVAHNPRLALEAFDRAIALLPASIVKPDSLQWAVAYWHRATAYQQLEDWNRAANDLATAETTLSKAIAAAAGDTARAQHFAELRQRVRSQRAEMLLHQGKRSEAQKVPATQ